MTRIGIAILGAAALAAAAPALAAPAPQDAKAVVAAASKAMGVEGLNSIKLWGSAATYTIGQNNNANGAWPQVNLNDYVRAIDFASGAAKTTAVTYGAPVTGGPAVKADLNQAILPGVAWTRQYDIWLTPWGFLKGAAANGATMTDLTVGGRKMKLVTWNPPIKAATGQPYKVIGLIGPNNIVERVDTWVEHPIFGDMKVEARFSDWRDANGLKYPTTTEQQIDGHPAFELQILGVAPNPTDIAKLVAAPPAAAPPQPPPAQGPASDKLADDVYRIRGAYNALAVGFKDYVVVFEPGPQNEARALAILAETRRLFPGKPIRYGVISHHHSDHTGGLEAVVAEGITIVTPEVNKAYLTRAYSGPRTLVGDALAKSGKKPIIEAMGDKRVFDDGTHSLEIHQIKGLPHADGLVVAWLPKEKLLVYADMFNLPTAAQPVPDPPVVGTQVFVANLERLKIEPERIMSIHTLNPDRLTNMEDIRSSLGLKK